jgi:hypothetical protein
MTNTIQRKERHMNGSWRGTFLGAVAGLALTFSAVTAHAVCGDMNNNGSVTIADCSLIFDVAAGPPDPAGLCGGAGALACGDLNADGSVNIADAIICMNAIAGNETTFPLCTGPTAPVACPGGTHTVNSNVTSNQTWGAAGCTHILDGTIFVNANVILTIQPGALIKGKKVSTNGSPSGLVFLRDSKINAAGTQTNPIVFTSDQAPGGRTKGDWGGLVINGRAPTNVPGGEGLAEGLSNVPFGGAESNDNSGVVRFVRVEFAGRALTVDNELNLITLNSVGAGTTIDHIQANVGLDDCHEWFGGTVKEKFLVGTACGDDGLDWQLGFTGSVQNAYIHQNIAVIESGGNGIEADNNENGFLLTPVSHPNFCNITVVGTRGQVGTPAGANQLGALLRRGTEGFMAKMIVEGFHSAGLQLQHATPGCSAGPALTGALLIRDSIFFDNGSTGAIHCSSGTAGNAPSPCDGCQFYDLLANGFGVVPDLCAASPLGCQDQNPAVNPGVAEAYPPVDPRPTNVAGVTNAFDCSGVDAFFTANNYIGAFDPNTASWLTTPWISFATN